MLKSSHIQLIHLLGQQSSYITANLLAAFMEVSIRSVKTYVKEINDIYPNTINSSKKGYTLNFNKAQEIMDSNDFHIPQTSSERVTYIINDLINGEVNMYDLCDELYVSLSTLKKDLRKVKRTLTKHNLKLIVKNDNMSLIGLEKNKRKILSSILYQESNVNFVNLKAIQDAFIDIDIEIIKDTILQTFEKYHFFINDYSLVNLVLHIAIATNRIQNGNVNTQNINDYPPIHVHELQLAKDVAKLLEDSFAIEYNEAEVYEMALLIISRATAIDYKSIDDTNIVNFIGEDCLDLVNELITSVERFYYIDLTESEFFIRFALHIRNLLIRSKNNYFSKNPLAEGIRSSCPLIYDVSVFMANIIQEKTSTKLNDDEIAYIAFHLGSTLGAQYDLNTKITAILYCPNYYNMNTRLTDLINSNFNHELLITNILTDESDFYKVAQADLIITTIPIATMLNTPTILINMFFSDKDITMLHNKIVDLKTTKKRNSFELVK